MGITKNKLSNKIIERIISRYFPNKKILSIVELTEGMFNAVYNISFEDGSGSILKVSPQNAEGLMSNEINLMSAEVQAMNIIRQYDFVHVAEVQVYDTTKTLCDSDYFVMERIKGDNWLFVKDRMSEENRKQIHNEIGVIQKQMTQIKGTSFGLLGDEKRFASLFDFFYELMTNVLNDVKAKQIEIGVSKENILEKLNMDKMIFGEVKESSLIHWDMWEGNIFVKDYHVSGIIDWERAMWGESFMDDRFRRHNRNCEFLKGFGRTEFTEKEKKRICWYDILLYITMMAEVTYRQYEDDGQFNEVKLLFDSALKDLSLL